ncbi:MAG TPA: hypothetical protein VN516_09485 [Candidatus Baltobacteraceae bacterium]|nr:hypothetical protein [Candidatus Baltobacteraceae bacterium]
MNRYQKNRKVINRCAFVALLVIAAILAIPTFGLSLLAAVAPKTFLAVGAGATGVLKFAALGMIAPFKFIEPVNDIAGVASNSIVTIKMPPNKRLNIVTIIGTVTKAATGTSTQSIPAVTDVVDLIQFKVGGKPQRTRLGSELFGATGLNALCDPNLAGTVVYTQSGNSSLSTIPVLIGSAADTAQKALLSNNTATTAVFRLPYVFSEPYRKEYDRTEALALPTGFDNGQNIGLCTLEVKIPDKSAASPAISAQNIQASLEYDDLLAKAGTDVFLVKEYRHTVIYAAAGDIECGNQLYLRDSLMRVSLLTTADQITRVVVKQGSRVLRDVTQGVMASKLIERDYTPGAVISNRFDIEFDLNDDPQSAPNMTPGLPLSIVATLATANDSAKQITVLSSYFGKLD